MIKKLIFSLILVFSVHILSAQKAEPYLLYNAKGKRTHYGKLVKEAASSNIVLFGEYHDDAIAHWLQLKLTKSLHERGPLALGAEMFERDTHEILKAYLSGAIEEKAFTDSVHSLWSNYSTDYRPLVEFAKANNVPFIATNIPRYLASAVYRGGFEVLDTVSDIERSWLPPLPPPYDATLPGYEAMLEMGGGHAGPNFPKAQAIKDATMAWHISQSLPENGVFVHYNGTYHSNNFEGIYWYLKQYAPDQKVLTIATVRQYDLSKLEEEYQGMADFILVVDEEMTRTYR
jgi:uncharacterized iron-regulated protein